jgi:photosystem II stability/assembly factor-like uncharacterized protein
MRRRICLIGLLAACLGSAHAQWQIEDSTTTADLRGIDSVGGGVAWASGTNGTVIRTEDGGYEWQPCAVPPGAEHLDFRGVQAFDANTVIVMSSGKGDLSRLYKTTDGCQTWKLIFTNPDPEGFWDAVLLNRFDKDGYLVGDPVNGSFRFWVTDDKGMTWQSDWQGADWKRTAWKGLGALPQEGAFAASNSALLADKRYAVGFVTGGPAGGRLFLSDDDSDGSRFHAVRLPLRTGSATSGAYSIELRGYDGLVVVGGDYLKPNDSSGTAAYSSDGGEHWRPAQTPPHGYRSSVAYDAATKTWITVGPNGTDISTDDGRNWRPMLPDPALHEAPDADRNWNAISLPFVVGPHGRIGKLDPPALVKH